MRPLPLACLILLAGCAHRAPLRTVEIPTGAAIHGAVDPVLGLDTWDAETLFALAMEAYRAGDLTRARAGWQRLLDDFPSDPLAGPAVWNRALCDDRLGALEQAAAALEAWAPAQSQGDARDAWLRAALLRQRAEQWEASRAALDALEPLLDGGPAAQEAAVLRAMLAAVDGRVDAAEQELDRIRRVVRKAALEGDRDPWMAAMVWYHAGLLYRVKARGVALDTPDDTEQLAASLDRKASYLLEARRHFKRTLEYRVPEWSGAAALGLGQVYEDFRQDVLAAPPPPDLQGEHLDVYRALLGERMQAFLVKAAADYRDVLRSADALQLDPAWRGWVQDALARCEAGLEVPDDG